MRLSVISSLLVAAPLVVHAAPAAAAGPPIYVLEVSTEDADDQAKALTSALKSRVKALPDRTLGEADISLQVVVLALKCGDVPDAACQGKIAEKINAQAYVWGTMRKQAGNQVLADLHLWQKGQPEVRQQFTYSDNLTEAADPALVRLADQMVQKLLNFGKVGTVRVMAARSIAGQLLVDGKPSGTFTNGQAELTLPVGEHRFEVRNGDRTLASAMGKVSATGVLDVQLADGSGVTDTGPQPGAGSWKKTAGYVGVGVGGAFILGGFYSMLKVNSVNKDDKFDAYRRGFGADEDICDRADRGTPSKVPGAATPSEAKDLCSTGSTFQTLQYVFFGLGAVSAGAGAYFLATAPKDGAAPPPATGRPRLRVTPVAGRELTGVDLRLVF